MEKKVVYIKVPILMDCSSLNVKSKVFFRFNRDIFSELGYHKLSVDDIAKILLDQHEIIEEIKRG